MQPLTVEDWERLKALLWEQNQEAGFSSAGLKIFQHGYRLFADNGPELAPTEEKVLRWWLDVLIDKLEAELGGIPAGGKADPRYITGFVIRRPVSR